VARTSRYSGWTVFATSALERPVTRHHHGFGSTRRPVVHGGVGDLHACEFADHGLEFEDGLEGALRDLRLIGRVGGEELAALHQRVNDDRPIVAIGAGTEKADVAVGVLRSGLLEVVDDLGFAHLARDVEVTREAIFGRDAGEEIVDGRCADLAEHALAFGVGFGQIAHYFSFYLETVLRCA
jgi:hypothetical protein